VKKTIHTKLSNAFSKKIQEIRKKSGLSQRDLAKKLKREHSLIARIELGERRVDMIEFYLICKACQVDPKKTASELMLKFEHLS
jgi:transcriptional regulator with XRE-family HTH domain